MTAGDLIVGVGTLALAAFTAWLAARTSAEVKISEEQISLSRENIEAQDRPFVIPTPRAPRGVLINPAFIANLENLGKGAALIESIQIMSKGGHEYLDDPFDGRVRPLAAASKLSISLPLKGSAPVEGTELTVSVHYRSPAGRRYSTRSTGVVNDETLSFDGHRRHEADAD
jgi:hypothetical protein